MFIKNQAPYLSIAIFLVGTFCYATCSSGQDKQMVTSRMLISAEKIDLSELTPSETNKLDDILNQEASPCGNDLSLGQTLMFPETCPLSVVAGQFVIEMLKQDYNIEEISNAYIARYAEIKGNQISIDGSPVLGAKKPTVTIVVFSDFECPFCAKSAEQAALIVKSYPENVALVFKHFPLKMHTTSQLAARAGIAAHRQGKFWELHDVLFSAQGSKLTPDRIRIMATGIGLDPDSFEEELISDGTTAALKADHDLGVKLGVSGTPHFFVNGRFLKQGISALEDRIKEEFLRREINNNKKTSN